MDRISSLAFSSPVPLTAVTMGSCGFSSRMRLDLVVNTMFKSAVRNNLITVNNPAIWRPILAIQDAATAFIRAVEASSEISGIFNIASGNYTVGEIGDYVKNGVTKYLGNNVEIEINYLDDFRNYKVSLEKAKNILGFRANYDIDDIVKELYENVDRFRDFDNNSYYNIEAFKNLEG